MKFILLSKYLILSLFITMSTDTFGDTKDLEKHATFEEIPQINIDNFDKVIMTNILKNYGSFEIVGPSVDELSALALEALKESKQILNLPIESLEKFNHDNFNGFQNVYKETLLARQRGGKKQVRNQLAFHFKPYLEPRIPEGIKELKASTEYYNNATNLLHRLYDRISDSFIEHEQKSIFKEGLQTSCLTLRKYFPGDNAETGISSHTDFGLLTLVVSDRDGLEILKGKNERDGRWLRAPYGSPDKPRFYVNIGDWLFLQTGNEEFAAGVHRVPNVEKDRYSLILFMNPPGVLKLSKMLITLHGVEMKYEDFLKAYRHDCKRDLKKCSEHFLKM